MDEARARGYADDTELAEVASLGVRLNIEAGRDAMAAVLQPVARAAWARVEDGRGPDELLAECGRALGALRLTVGATSERRFLGSVVAHLTGPAREAGRGARKIVDDRG